LGETPCGFESRPGHCTTGSFTNHLDFYLIGCRHCSGALYDGYLAMLVNSLEFLAAYLAVGLITCLLARKGWPDEWDETLVASVLGPLLLALAATAVAASFLRSRLYSSVGDSGNQTTPG
jgi:hypothetical protein